jgi:AcrR family transcriptional regulator
VIKIKENSKNYYSIISFMRLDMSENQQTLMRKKVLLSARNLFFSFGYSKVTMDELASELNMSKRTLYQLYNSKNRLLEAVIYDFFQEFQENINKIINNQNKNALVSLKQIISLIQKQTTKFSIHGFEDIRKNNPQAWQLISSLREKMFNSRLREILNRAKKENNLREDIDVEIIILIILNTIQSVVNPEIISQLSCSTEDVIEMLSKFIISGIIKSNNNII